jgi:hypothetical protein
MKGAHVQSGVLSKGLELLDVAGMQHGPVPDHVRDVHLCRSPVQIRVCSGLGKHKQ